MPQKAVGTTLSVDQAGTTTRIGKLKSISELKCDSEALDVTTLDAPDGCRTYVQGFRDAGEVTLEGYLEAGDGGQTLLRQLYDSGEEAAFQIAFPGGAQASFSAFVKSCSLGAAQVDGAVGFGAVLRVCGKVTVA